MGADPRHSSADQRCLVAGFFLLSACVAGLHGVVFAAMSQATLTADRALWGDILVYASVLCIAGMLAIARYSMAIIGALLAFAGLLLAAARGGIMLTYLTYNLDRQLPLWDATLAEIDAHIGFHWPAMFAWFVGHPVLSDIAYHLYNLFLPQKIFVPVMLVFACRLQRAQTAFLAAMIALFLTHGIAFCMPAVGTYTHYGINPADHAGIRLALGGICGTELAALRSGELVSISHRALYGLIAFPSYHALMAVVFTWALWDLRLLRWPAAILNGGMLVATPLQGNHYLCETLAGALLAPLCIYAASRAMRALARAASGQHRRFQRARSAAQVLTWVPASRWGSLLPGPLWGR